MTDHPQEHLNLSNYSGVPSDCECAEFRAEGKRGIVTLYFEDGNRAIEWLNTPSQEHASLDEFADKVEAAAADVMREVLRDAQEAVSASLDAVCMLRDQQQARGRQALNIIADRLDVAQSKLHESAQYPVYTQPQVDALIAEARAEERERIILWCRAQHKFCTGFANMTDDYDAAEKLDAQAVILAQCEEFIRKDHP